MDKLNHHKPQVNTAQRLVIMKRLQSKNKVNTTHDPKGISCYKKQIDLSGNKYFDTVNTKNNSNLFWKKSLPYFSNQHSEGESKITVNENGKTLLDNCK